MAEPPECFTRDYGCTEVEWRRWLPEATHGHAWRATGSQGADVTLGAGRLLLAWRVLPERRIALIRLPRLEVEFRFESVPADTRAAFLKRFDLHTQRGGG